MIKNIFQYIILNTTLRRKLTLQNCGVSSERKAGVAVPVLTWKTIHPVSKINKAMQDQQNVLKYLVSVEKLANEILSDKQEIIMLDKRRNQNREALRDLSKSSQRQCWVTVGSVLIKHNVDATKSLLETDQKQLNIDINKLQSNLKVKVNNLRDLEMQPPVPGLMLVPLSSKETEEHQDSAFIKITRWMDFIIIPLLTLTSVLWRYILLLYIQLQIMKANRKSVSVVEMFKMVKP